LRNISVYSWPSHCRNYLESIEEEKRRRARPLRRTLCSGSWDSKSFDQNNYLLGSDDAGWTWTLGSLDAYCGTCGDTPGNGCTIEADPGALVAKERDHSEQPRLMLRERVRVFVLDAEHSSGPGLASLKSAIADTAALDVSAECEVGFGVASMMSFQGTCNALEEANVDPHALDFVVCSAGAELYVWTDDDGLIAYAPYERHIGTMWDKTAVRTLLKGIPAGPVSRDCRDSLLLKLPEDTVGSGKTVPFHILAELAGDAKRNGLVAAQVIKRMRQKGIRCQVVTQVRELSPSGVAVSFLHVTPICATRSLALRFLLARFGISMTNATFVCAPSFLTVEGQQWRVASAVSDMRSLLAGSQSVVLIPPEDEPKANPDHNETTRLMEELEAGPAVYGGRVSLMNESV